ncbi:MAG: hypothetical protein A3A97_02035 [Candidatus Terrybacteria bacterium RIFCSPLOWO2_01_FULL_40_23]|uniref:Uncharacterized protein n=1 Tax=Candidatus Terrybacteria bacterium RIFCSPLOWO2_01_FULL_40_23 TaxID=1802366 RepID=A0A1G2PSV1_9BACT|nr:MAG: hypothetical protein A3A97_02035 [Candidatus Terrybacteria bacterium RIFCSPLOWO2_01_FULL_40_23]
MSSDLKKFDLVRGGRDIQIGVIVSDPITINLFDECTASAAAEQPFDIENPDSYDREYDDFVAVYVYAPDFRGLELCRLVNLQRLNLDWHDGYIPFDHATGALREVLSLKKFAEDLWSTRESVQTT